MFHAQIEHLLVGFIETQIILHIDIFTTGGYSAFKFGVPAVTAGVDGNAWCRPCQGGGQQAGCQ